MPDKILNGARWSTNDQTVTGGHGEGTGLNQFTLPYSIDTDDDGSMFIDDAENHRIMQWKPNATQGKVIVGGKGQGGRTDQLNQPVTVLVDRINHSLIVSEEGNGRVTRWSLDTHKQKGTEGEMIISNIISGGLAMDNEGSLYVSDYEKHEVRRYGPDDRRQGVIVAGGNGRGDGLNQLNSPRNIFVDDEHSIYVSERGSLLLVVEVKGKV